MPANDGIVIMGVKGLVIGAGQGRGIQVEDTPVPIFLTNDREVLQRLFSQEFIAQIGRMAFNDILSEGYALYSRFNLTLDTDEAKRAFLHGFVFFSQLFFDALWFLKDNAIDSGVAFLEYRNSYSSFYFTSSRNFNSQGLDEVCEFSVAEVNKARDFYKSHMVIDILEAENAHKHLLAAPTLATKSSQKFSRASYFLSIARQTPDLGVKLSLYMSCLETLFSTDSGELTHKLAERAALFIGKNGAERKEIFSRVKRGYDVRSKVLHGGGLTLKGQQDLHVVSRQVDDVVRIILLKLLNTPELLTRIEGEDNEINSYFADLLFDTK
jgi:hypothetical protein